MSEETIKLGFMKAGVCVNINLVYFVPNKDFDLYAKASLFKWQRPEAKWNEFAMHLVADDFGSIYSHVDVPDIASPVGLYTREGDKYGLVKGPMPMSECLDMMDADKYSDSRVFQIDTYSPTRMGINRLLECSSEIVTELTAQYVAYLAAMVQDKITEGKYADMVLQWNESPSRKTALDIGKDAEGTYAMKRTKRIVEDGYYSVSGFSGEQSGDANILYTVGLSQNASGYEVFCREKVRIEIMSELMSHTAKLVFEHKEVLKVNQELQKFDDMKRYRPRLVLCRNEKIDAIFTYRLSDKFEVYRLMIDPQ